uniref:UDP-glycosyltransferase 13 n=1 Tax=Mangifera indica TaxID=29780 RepID=UPI00209BBA95|nr:Chain A, UDP-glycosyltransferase 13 [Mangifera indica]7VAA_B Chain B, UDP-glycosyltransferase 13 [Mangifera indica]
MSASDALNSCPHVALLLSSGMGHLTPCLRFAATLVQHHCRVTIITNYPTVSVAESRAISLLLSDFPQITEKQFHLLPFDPSTANTTDPFFLRVEAIRRSAHLLNPLLSSISPPLSALVIDSSLFSSFVPVAANLDLPSYVLFTSSTRMCSLEETFPAFVASKTNFDSIQLDDVIEIPGFSPVPVSSVPPVALNLNHLFTTMLIQNGQSFRKANGILINTFEALEGGILPGINDKRAADGLPPYCSVGPLLPCKFEKTECSAPVKWLDDQPEGSVVYVSFGSHFALSSEQIKELGDGLIRSGCRFLWVVKCKKVDQEDEESLDELLGRDVLEKIKKYGFVIKNWVNQQEILDHRAVGGFVTHGGWNSSMEAVWHGVPMLVWPQFGDQKINAEVIERSGLGMWVKRWGWGTQQLVKGEEIGERIKDLMGNNPLRVRAKTLREEARKAIEVGGSSEKTLKELIENWKKTSRKT